MSRLNLTNEQEAPLSLDELIPTYYLNKQELDSYKDICDKENSQIKALMEERGEDEYKVDGYKAKRTVVTKENLNEYRLLDVLKKYNITDAIKTKEYVDMDVLENYLYNNEPSSELASDLASCKETKTVIQLRVTKAKEKKEDA